MKQLKRMLLIHWHHYEKEVIEFGNINFLTGKTAAGKSTIIDALQLVLLGDTGGSFFNKAANTQSARTLKSYLFGEMGDDGDAGFRYLRNGRFSSYVALEFYDTDNQSFFTAGIVCDCFQDQSYDWKWFVLHKTGFPESLFIDESTNTPYDIAGLKAYLGRTVGKKRSGLFEFYDTNKRYQEVTLGKFGQLKQKYRTLLRKAVPFSPISDIEKFITESICDVKNTIDVEQMQSGIRQYKNLEDDARVTSERIGALEKIHTVNEEYEKEKERYRRQEYIVIRAEEEEFAERERAIRRQIEERQEEIRAKEAEMRVLSEKLSALETEIDEKEEIYRGSNIVQREKELKKRMTELEAEISRLVRGLGETAGRLRTYGQNWLEQLERAERAGFSMPDNEHEDAVDGRAVDGRAVDGRAVGEKGAGVKGILRYMAELPEDGREVLPALEDFPYSDAAAALAALHGAMLLQTEELRKRAAQLQTDIEALTRTIRDLEKGIKPYPEQVSALKRVLQNGLFQKYGKTVEVSVLADLLEVRDPSWRNALEGYLDKQKFYLLVPEAYWRDAVKLYEKEKREKKIYDAGLVDVGKLRKEFTKKPAPGSLAEEIETDHPDARLYADYLLGNVMKCDDAAELNRYRTAITRSCMLYKGYVSRSLNPARYAVPFIGRRSMELLLQQKKAELKEQTELLKEVQNRHRILSAAASTPYMSENEAAGYRASAERAQGIAPLELELAEVRKEYDGLDLLYLERMRKEIEDLKQERENVRSRHHSLDKKNAMLSTEIRSLEEDRLPEAVGAREQVRKRIEERFDGAWILEVGEPRFRDVLDKTKKGDFGKSLRDRYYASMKQTEKQRDDKRRERTRLRADYNAAYRMPYDIELESNQHFDRELSELSGIRLPEYLEKIKDAKQKAYEQFRDDFIAKIKSNIESVSRQIDELNDSLKRSVFGTDRYRFVKSPRPEYRNYYDMIMDPLLMDTGGWNIASSSFNEKYQKEIDELFQLLILNEANVSAERRKEYEASIKKFTDYKTYLVFDLIVTDDQGEEQRLSRTLLKKSGGETQIPFYIALLASFSQVCRIRNKNQNNTLRLIILDEAFSKMDGERIRESIQLLRRFELQAIFSAPPEKIPDIAPLCDRNIAVYKDRRHSFTRHFDPKEIMEEEPDGEEA